MNKLRINFLLAAYALILFTCVPPLQIDPTPTITEIPLPDDTTLTGLTVSSGTLSPAFSYNKVAYTSSVNLSVTSITVTPTALDSGSKIEVQINAGGYAMVTSGTASGSLSLIRGVNTIEVKVTSKDGLTNRIYVLKMSRYSDDATLLGLTISSGTLDPAFDPSITSYACTVDMAIASVTVTPTAADANSAIAVRINAGQFLPVTSGYPSDSLPLSAGVNIINVRVTAEDGSTKKTYTITVSRLLDNTTLTALTISSGTLAPDFSPFILAYGCSIDFLIPSVTVTPTEADLTSTVEVQLNGHGFSIVTSGSPSPDLILIDGVNTIDVKVTTLDTLHSKTYTISASHISDDTNLSSLTISTGLLDPVFDKNTTAYNVRLNLSSTTESVTPTVEDSNATIEVQFNGGGWSTLPSGTQSQLFTLISGSNQIDTRVTARNGITQKTYMVTVYKYSDDPYLSALTISNGNLTPPTFAPSTRKYSCWVNNTISSVTVTPTHNDPGATIQVRINGGIYSPVDSGQPSGPLSLNTGANLIEILVTAQDTQTTLTYKIRITQIPNANVLFYDDFFSAPPGNGKFGTTTGSDLFTENYMYFYDEPTFTNVKAYYPLAGTTKMFVNMKDPNGVCLYNPDPSNPDFIDLGGAARIQIGANPTYSPGGTSQTSAYPLGYFDLSKPYIIYIKVIAAPGSGNLMIYVDNNTSGSMNNSPLPPIPTVGCSKVMSLGCATIRSNILANGGSYTYAISSGERDPVHGIGGPAEIAGTLVPLAPNADDLLASGQTPGSFIQLKSDGSGETVIDSILVVYKNTPTAPPAAPTLIPGNTTLDVSWGAVAGATTYQVFYNTTDYRWTATKFIDLVYNGDFPVTNATITGLTNSTPYYVWVLPKNAEGTGIYSPSSSATPAP